MPLGGANIGWNEASPAETDVADAGPIRSIETAIRNAMGSEHNWVATGGANTGYHLLGSARPFYDVQSNVSSSGSDGRLMVTSDTSRLFHVGSGGTMYLGGQNDLSVGSSPVGGQRFYWATEFGVDKVTISGGKTVTFPNSGFSGLPFTQVSALRPDSSGGTTPVAYINALTATTLQVQVWDLITAGAVSGVTFFWQSIGTRTF